MRATNYVCANDEEWEDEDDQDEESQEEEQEENLNATSMVMNGKGLTAFFSRCDQNGLFPLRIQIVRSVK